MAYPLFRPDRDFALRVPTPKLRKPLRDSTHVSGFASRVPSLNAVVQPEPVRVDKQVRKANWAEIEPLVGQIAAESLAPVVNPMNQPVLPRLRADSQVETRAQKHIEYGDSLARRRSFYAVREEFVLALLLVSSSHKTGSDSDVYANRLAQALTAMDEVGDFAAIRNGGELLRLKALSHKTQLLRGQNSVAASPKKAMELYFGFAQSQLQQAVGYSVAGSQALHALGKLETMASVSSQKTFASQTKALVFFRSALDANPNNALCGNDLGVLLFDMGRLDEAEIMLKSSFQVAPSHGVLMNIAALHRQRAEGAMTAEQRQRQVWLASVAEKEAQKYQSNPRDRGLADSQWATASEFQENAAVAASPLQRNTGNAGIAKPHVPVRARSGSLIDKVKGWN